MVFGSYTQITPVVLHTSCREIQLNCVEMFSEMHYFRSSETWTNQWRKFQLNYVQFLGISRSFCVFFT